MKVLVTGGAGFIGSHIIEKLLAEQYEVVVVDDLSTGSSNNIPDSVTLVKMDVRERAIAEVFAAERPDFVIHLAAQTMVPVSLKDPHYDCNVNILGTVNVLEAARMHGVKRVLFASSAAVYGDQPQLPIPETGVLQPTSFYGLSKLTVERYLELYYQIYGLSYAIMRYANVYGERQGDSGEGGVVSIFSRHIAENKDITIYGDGTQTRDFVYVGDVAAANVLALTAQEANRVYNISTQTEVSVNELVALLAEVSAKSVTPIYSAPRSGDIYRSMLSHAAASTNLAWQPQVTLRDGLYRTYHSLVQK